MDFIQQLRLNSILGNNSNSLVSPPDLNGGHNIDPMSIAQSIMAMRRSAQPQMGNVASSMTSQPNPEGEMHWAPPAGMSTGFAAPPPMPNTAVGPGVDNANPIDVFLSGTGRMMTPYQSAQIGVQRDRLDQNSAIAMQKNAIADYKAKHPGLKALTPKGGNVVFYDPSSGETIDSGISTGTMTDEDLAEIRGEQAIAAIDERGKETRKTQGERSDQRLGEIAASIAGKKEIAAVGKPLAPTQERARVGNDANKFIIEHPELKQYVVIDPATKSVSIADNAPPEAAKMIKDSLFPSDISIPAEKKPEIKKPEPTKPVSKYKVTVKG